MTARRISFNPNPRLRAGQNCRVRLDRQNVLDLPLRLVDVRARQINLVDDRDDRESLLRRQMHVGHVCASTPRRVHNQQRAFACGQTPRTLRMRIAWQACPKSGAKLYLGHLIIV